MLLPCSHPQSVTGHLPCAGPTPGIRDTKTNKVWSGSTIRLGWRETKAGELGGAVIALKGRRGPEEKRQVLLWDRGAESR